MEVLARGTLESNVDAAKRTGDKQVRAAEILIYVRELRACTQRAAKFDYGVERNLEARS